MKGMKGTGTANLNTVAGAPFDLAGLSYGLSWAVGVYFRVKKEGRILNRLLL